MVEPPRHPGTGHEQRLARGLHLHCAPSLSACLPACLPVYRCAKTVTGQDDDHDACGVTVVCQPESQQGVHRFIEVVDTCVHTTPHAAISFSGGWRKSRAKHAAAQ